MKEINYQSSYTGILGEKTGYKDLHVGDIINVKTKDKDSKYENNLMVVFDTSRKRYAILGFTGYSLMELNSKYTLEKVASYKIITEENIASLSNFNVTLSDKLPERTLEQIKEELGYDFKLVKSIK